MNEVVALWFLSLAMSVFYTWILHEGTSVEKVKFVGAFMGVFTVMCFGVSLMGM